MKIITKKNISKAPKTLYLVRFNIVGLVFGPLKLTFDGDSSWWDKSENYFVSVDGETISLDKIKKGRYSLWDYVSEDKEKSQIFYNGAQTLVSFMKETWFDSIAK